MKEVKLILQSLQQYQLERKSEMIEKSDDSSIIFLSIVSSIKCLYYAQ